MISNLFLEKPRLSVRAIDIIIIINFEVVNIEPILRSIINKFMHNRALYKILRITRSMCVSVCHDSFCTSKYTNYYYVNIFICHPDNNKAEPRWCLILATWFTLKN